NNNVGTVRPRVRQRIHNADELRRYTTGVARQLFGGNNEGPKSPPKAPKKVNVSKYEKMLKNLENKNKNTKNTKNTKPNNENKNVASWFNNSMTEAKKSNIPKDKRVFLLTDMTNNGKIKQVWDRRFLNGLVESYENRYNRVREANDPFFTSPLTRKKFSKNDIKAYPPTNATKKRIKQIMNSKDLIAEVNKIIKITNRERNDPWARSDVMDPIKNLIRLGSITSRKQLEELNTIYQACGREMFIVGHKRNGAYYKAYVDGKFKPHHMKFMKDAPTIVSKLYDPFITKKSASGTVPLYKLPSSVVKYLSQFEKYMRREIRRGHSNFQIRHENYFLISVLRQVVREGYVNYLRKETKEEMSTLKNAKLRNELSEYYNWHEMVRNAAS
ncbi:MAG: hypothetical protein CMO46_05430, partial [Verrucomicrobiales bacterium]|nr:hypothetical protein [Verrucomicrobiales bacterium]